MKNYELVNVFYQILSSMGVDEVLICAGARNAPLVSCIDQFPFSVKSYFEERSAAFYALGRIQATQKPVVIMTTSGTAVAELLPAVIEAYYQGLPLVVVSADRPKSYRGSGAPQSIEQAGLFSSYVQQCYDWDVDQKNFEVLMNNKNPIHFNLCFDEPLLDQPQNIELESTIPFTFVTSESANLKKITHDVYHPDFGKFKKPLIIIGQLSQEKRAEVYSELVRHQIPHYAEALSGLLGDVDLAQLQLNDLELVLSDLLFKNEFDSVVRIGGIPTLRLWRDLEKKLIHIPVLNITEFEFSGLSRESLLADFSILNDFFKSVTICSESVIFLKDQFKFSKNKILEQFKNSEQNYIFELSKIIYGQPVYIGNSLPIREWDLFSVGPFSQTYGNRGANGIDGQISTYLGWAKQFDVSWALVGDLTALYDLGSFGLNSDSVVDSMKRVVIVNNCGGQIFKKVFNHQMFLNTHQIEFSGLAKLWGWEYLCIEKISDMVKVAELSKNKTQAHFIIEIQTQQSESDAVWKMLSEVCQISKS